MGEIILWPDFNRRTVGHSCPYLVDLDVRHRYAAVGPVLKTVSRAHKAVTIWQSVKKNIASWRHTLLKRRRPIMGTRIRNVDRLVKLAVRIAEVENINAFRRLVIALSGFRTDRVAPQSDLVRLDLSPVALQSQNAFLLQNNNPVSKQRRNRRLRLASPNSNQTTKPVSSRIRIPAIIDRRNSREMLR